MTSGRTESLAVRLDTKWRLDPASGCWEWAGSKNDDGYGSIRDSGRSLLAHRVSYEIHVEAIPAGMELDHLCRNHGCINPEHLEPVTHAENMRRSVRPLLKSCHAGHEFTPENTYYHRTPNGRRARRCRACALAANARHYQTKTHGRRSSAAQTKGT